VLEGTPTKLKKENVWGARVVGNVDIGEGEDIRITTRKGKQWISVVNEVTWTDGHIHLLTLKRKEFSGKCADCERACKKIYERCWDCAQKLREETPPW